MIKTLAIVLFYLIFCVQITSAQSSNGKPDLAREKRMATEVEDAILDGEVIYLNDGSHEFMAIDTEAENVTKGAVIILHGRGFHPNWEDAIFPVRTLLPAKGWRTLSLQMPVLVKTAKYYDYLPIFPFATPRIDAGINYLKNQGINNIVLFAHSCGAHMAMKWVKENKENINTKISAYIGAGMGATDYQQFMESPFPLTELPIPILDIYGEKEYPAVLQMAPDRLSMMNKAGNEKSRQIKVMGANHYFTDKGDELVNPIVKWLDSL